MFTDGVPPSVTPGPGDGAGRRGHDAAHCDNNAPPEGDDNAPPAGDDNVPPEVDDASPEVHDDARPGGDDAPDGDDTAPVDGEDAPRGDDMVLRARENSAPPEGENHPLSQGD